MCCIPVNCPISLLRNVLDPARRDDPARSYSEPRCAERAELERRAVCTCFRATPLQRRGQGDELGLSTLARIPAFDIVANRMLPAAGLRSLSLALSITVACATPADDGLSAFVSTKTGTAARKDSRPREERRCPSGWTRALSDGPTAAAGRLLEDPSRAALVATEHGFCRLREGAVDCWGGGYGQRPSRLDGVSDAEQLWSDGRDACALTTREIACWRDVATANEPASVTSRPRPASSPLGAESLGLLAGAHPDTTAAVATLVKGG